MSRRRHGIVRLPWIDKRHTACSRRDRKRDSSIVSRWSTAVIRNYAEVTGTGWNQSVRIGDFGDRLVVEFIDALAGEVESADCSSIIVERNDVILNE